MASCPARAATWTEAVTQDPHSLHSDLGASEDAVRTAASGGSSSHTRIKYPHSVTQRPQVPTLNHPAASSTHTRSPSGLVAFAGCGGGSLSNHTWATGTGFSPGVLLLLAMRPAHFREPAVLSSSQLPPAAPSCPQQPSVLSLPLWAHLGQRTASSAPADSAGSATPQGHLPCDLPRKDK